MKRLVHKLTLLAAVFIVTGICSMMYTYATLQKWQSAVARVDRNELVPFTVGKKTRYRAELELRYIAKDVTYRVPYSVPMTYKSFEAGRDDLLRYRVGSNTTVYWNPNDPVDFLVETKNPVRFFTIPFLITAVGVILGLICVRMYLSMRRCFCPDCATSVLLHHRFCLACGRKLPRTKKLVRG